MIYSKFQIICIPRFQIIQILNVLKFLQLKQLLPFWELNYGVSASTQNVFCFHTCGKAQTILGLAFPISDQRVLLSNPVRGKLFPNPEYTLLYASFHSIEMTDIHIVYFLWSAQRARTSYERVSKSWMLVLTYC